MLGRGGGGIINAGTMDVVNDRLEAAIEDLRIKYEKKAAAEEKAKAEAAEAARDKDADRAAAAAAAEPSLTMDDPDVERMRMERIAALREASKVKKRDLEAGHGELHEIVEEDFLKEVTSTQFVMVHFYHPEFEKCKVMDKHLRILAPRCTRVKMLRLNAERAPFFTAKLKVRVLPSLIFFKDGVAIGRQTGFEGLSMAPDSTSAAARATDDFPTMNLYRIIAISGMLGDAAREHADSDEEEDDRRGEASVQVVLTPEEAMRKMAAMRAAALASLTLDDDA